MAHFPSYPLKQPHGQTSLKALGVSSFPLLVKKSKGVHLYDSDGNKFVDFFLQEGEVVFGHGAAACTKYAKNALAYGFSAAGGHPKDACRAQRLWEQKLKAPVSLYNNILEALCTLAQSYGGLQAQNPYIKQLISPLDGLIPTDKGLVLYEPALGESGDCALHSRFFYRGSPSIDRINLLHSSPFGGSPCTLIFGEKLPSPPLTPQSAALLVQGAKFQPRPFLDFQHPLLEMHTGYGLLKKEIGFQKALETGLIIKGPLVFFSPLHGESDLKRLERFLDTLPLDT